MQVDVKKPSQLTKTEIGGWQAFHEADPALRSPYFAPGFARACEHAREDTRVAVIRHDGQIKGFLPFHAGPFGYSRPLGGPLGDFHGLIAEPSWDVDIAKIMRSAGIHVYPFILMPSTQKSFAASFETSDICHSANLRHGFDAWYADRMAAHKKGFSQYGKKIRKLEAAHGALRFVADDRDPRAFETLLKWKRAQYNATRVFDVFSVPWTSALLRAIWAQREEGFAGQLSTLYAGEDLVAAHFGMRSRHVAHHWFPAYNVNFSRFGPGHALLMELIKHHTDTGIEQLDFGAGEMEFKYHFGGQTDEFYAGIATIAGLASFCLNSASMVQQCFEALPLGGVSRLPLRAMNYIDRQASFRLIHYKG